MQKLDLKKERKRLYERSATEVTRLDVPEIQLLLTDKEGDTNTLAASSRAVEALFRDSCMAQFLAKREARAIN